VELAKLNMYSSNAASTIITFQGKRLVMDNQKNLYLIDHENSHAPLMCRTGVLCRDMLVLKENLLINMPLNYSEREQKIIAFTVSQIKDSDTMFFPVVLPTQLIAEFLKVKTKSMYHDIRNIQENLRKATPLPWISNNEIVISSFPFFSYVASNDALNVFLINERLSSFLLSLQTNAGKLIADDYKLSYTKFPLIIYSKLHGKYTLRLYEILSKNVYKKFTRINIIDLLKILNIEGSYCNYKFFNRDIMRLAYKEINNKSNLTFDYEIYKVGKSVAGISFYIYNKNIEDTLKQIKEELFCMGMTKVGINNIFVIRKISYEIIRDNLDYVRDILSKANKIRNVPSFLYKAIIDDYARNTKEAKKNAIEAYIKKENQVPENIELRDTQTLINEHKMKIDIAIRTYLKDKHAKDIVETYILHNPSDFTTFFVGQYINMETVTIDELLAKPYLYRLLCNYILKNKIVQIESLEEFINTNCKKIDQLALFDNAIL
jgi:plasmid replication initiation protein